MPAPKPKTKRNCKNCGKEMFLSPWQIAANQRYCSHECAHQARIGVPNIPNSKPKITKVCEYCGKKFKVHPFRSDIARFCSQSCSTSSRTGEQAPRWKGGPVKKVCQKCGKEYEVPQIRANKSLYCSKSCHSSAKLTGEKAPWWKGGQEKKACPYCGKSFFHNRGDKHRKYCSTVCHDAARMKRVKLICANCGKKFQEKLSKASRYENSFCSHRCYSIYNQGENNCNWNGGSSFEPYPPTFNNEFKHMIRERDNYTCAVCGKRGKCVHHINYVKNDTNPENVITLCRSCHTKTNSNREYWQEYFSKMPS